MRYIILALFISVFSISALAEEAESYDCVFTDNQDSQDAIHLEDAFSVTENMRMGSVTFKSPNGPAQVFQTRVYQFFMPDNERFIQMWYGDSSFHIDGQMSVSGDNLQFAATLDQNDSHRPLFCSKPSKN